jgi:2-polyprenyl-3-methyl-5-hydroxy-6-metoxy-1,4-benzoquinol methylase
MNTSDNRVVPGDRRGCDICGSYERGIVHEQRFVTFDAAAGLLSGYDVAVCGSCGFVYADGVPAPAVFDRYYREMSKHEPSSDAARPLPPYRLHNIDLIASHVTSCLPDRAARILDVGVGSGDILLALRKSGYRDLTGLDPSPRTADILQQEHGLRVLNTPISELRSCQERFDVILLSGVLEHLRDLRSTLLLLKSLLSETGHMCIAVPDASRFTECVESPFQYFSTEHINFFTANSLESLLAGVGMQLQGECRRSTALLGYFKEPVIQAIFKTATTLQSPVADSEGAEQVLRYVARCKERQEALAARIQGFLDSGETIVIWGAGSLTMNLLSDARFSRLRVAAFVDSNQNYRDKTIRGIPVISPQALRHLKETILIVSYSYEHEIRAQIRDVHRLDNPVVGLFSLDDGG